MNVYTETTKYEFTFIMQAREGELQVMVHSVYLCTSKIKQNVCGTRCLWRLPTRSGVSQGFCQWEKLILMYRVSQKKAVKSNPGKFLRKCNFNFFNAKNWPIFASFEPFFPSISILLIFGIEQMFPQDSQILVDDSRHKNFAIWTFLA